MVKTSDCGSDMRGFESHYPPHFLGVQVHKLLLVFIVSLSTVSVFAATSKVTLYDCHPDNYSTIANIVPGAVWDEKDCTRYGSPSSQAYKGCTKDVREYNQNTLKLYKAGKCQKSGYRISGTDGDLKCSMDYDSEKIKGYATIGSRSLSESCLKNLAKEIKAQYPDIKGDSKYGFVDFGNNGGVKFSGSVINKQSPSKPFKQPTATGKKTYYGQIK